MPETLDLPTVGSPPPGTKGGWGLPTPLGVLIGLAALLVIAQGISQVASFKSILAASFMALNLVIVVWPIQKLLARFIPRFLSSLIAGLIAIAILGGLLWALGWAISRLVVELPGYSRPFQNLINSIVDLATQNGIDTNTVYEEAIKQLQGLNVSTIVSTLSSVASSVSGAVYLVFLIVMILIFMTMDSTNFGDRITRLGERHNPTLAWALTSFAHGTRRYWVVASAFGLVVALCDWVLLGALAVPLATVWALFSFVTNYIPNVGFIIGLVPPVIMALLAGGWQTALWVAIGYTVLNVVIQGIIQPRVSGGAVGMTATVAILSLLIWATILGPLGALLAIPATLLVKTLFIDIDPNLRWMNALIASNPRTSEEDPIKLSELLERAKLLRKTPPPATVEPAGELVEAETADEPVASQPADK
jgi:predicted PurR-regulated permease PerM